MAWRRGGGKRLQHGLELGNGMGRCRLILPAESNVPHMLPSPLLADGVPCVLVLLAVGGNGATLEQAWYTLHGGFGDLDHGWQSQQTTADVAEITQFTFIHSSESSFVIQKRNMDDAVA